MYAIREKTKAAVQVCAACGGTYEKAIQEPFRHHRAKNRNKPRGYSPTQIICVSFVIVIALGTLLLSLPIASRYGGCG